MDTNLTPIRTQVRSLLYSTYASATDDQVNTCISLALGVFTYYHPTTDTLQVSTTGNTAYFGDQMDGEGFTDASIAGVLHPSTFEEFVNYRIIAHTVVFPLGSPLPSTVELLITSRYYCDPTADYITPIGEQYVTAVCILAAAFLTRKDDYYNAAMTMIAPRAQRVKIWGDDFASIAAVT